MVERIISLACIDRIFLKATGKSNLDIDASNMMIDILQKYALELLKNAIQVRNITNRKTIKGNDIKLSNEIVKTTIKIW